MPAHPRSRGENASSKIGPASSGGSSPLTRGKLKLTTYLAPSNRLIPAHAGKTMTLRKRGCARTAHPRSRGENTRSISCLSSAKGSSPLTRGKRLGPVARETDGRLIPAHAGKTSSGNRVPYSFPAHPRSRGENITYAMGVISGIGSSPLTRGKLEVRGACPSR